MPAPPAAGVTQRQRLPRGGSRSRSGSTAATTPGAAGEPRDGVRRRRASAGPRNGAWRRATGARSVRLPPGRGRTMVLSRKGRERALMGRRSGCPRGAVGAWRLPEPRRRNSRGVRMARSRPTDLPGTAGVLAGIVDDGAPPRARRSPALRGSAGFRNGRGRASRGPARTPALPGEARAAAARVLARLSRNSRSAPVPGRPPAPRPANPAIANPAIPDPETAPARSPASRNSRIVRPRSRNAAPRRANGVA